MKMVRLFAPAVLLAALTPWSGAQTGPQGALADRLDAWRASHGQAWQMVVDESTQTARFIYGGSAPAFFAAHSDADFLALARQAARVTQPLHGIESETLIDESVLFLPLASAGSTDKMTVQFRQAVHGVPVVHGFLNVLFDAHGRLLSVDTTALPGARAIDTQPSLSPANAEAFALESFVADKGVSGQVITAAHLVIDQVLRSDRREGALAYEVDVMWQSTHDVPVGVTYRIDADTGAVLSRDELVHNFDVSGTVFTKLTQGVAPDTGTNPPVNVPLAHIQVSSASGNAITDMNGNFNIVGATAPLNVTVAYNGPFTTTVNSTGTTYSLGTSLAAPTGNVVSMNPSGIGTVTAEANSANWIGRLRDWTRAVNPADATADFDALSNVNLAQTCNAYYAGSSVNFFLPGGGCPNTAYSTVVAHEMGHWLNVNYGSGNGGDGFGEGNADVFGMYLTDQPVIAQDFFGIGQPIRTGLNTTAFCGDLSPGCHGEVHFDGEVLMGALWKVRARLKVTLGASVGAATADLLFNSWMNAYNDTQIKTIIRTHWLTLDDDDGDINNGTPHYTDINSGFVDQQFPSYNLSPITISQVTALPNTTNQVGPYNVTARIVAAFSPPVVGPALFWRVNGGAFTSVAMTSLGSDNYGASIPGQTSYAKVEYYLRAQNSASATAFYPLGAPVTLQRFIVGVEQVFYSNDFETDSSGWTSSVVTLENDWQYGTPTGKAGDPLQGSSGTKVYGNDLGLGAQNGSYSDNEENWLRSPSINLTSCAHPTLRFKRWLNVQDSLHDQARIRVNGTQVYVNPTSGNLNDTAWTEMEIDISAQAAGVSPTVIEWSLKSDGSINFGGWNIDDVQVVALSAVGQSCEQGIAYCTPKTTSLGTHPFLTAVGAPSASLSNFRIELREGTYFKSGILFHGLSSAANPFQGGTMCAAPPITRDVSFTTDFFGYAPIPLPVTPSMMGQTWYLQTWFRDPPASFGSGLSNALQVGFCN